MWPLAPRRDSIPLGLKEEKKGKGRVAGDPDGIPDSLSIDQLQRLIEGL
jgi:hypothetical protein